MVDLNKLTKLMPELSGIELRLLLYLSNGYSYAFSKKLEGFTASYSQIRKYTGIKCNNSIIEGIKTLTEKGLITHKTVWIGGKCKSTSVFTSTVIITNETDSVENKDTHFIKTYLNPDCYWDNGMSVTDKINVLKEHVTDESLDFASKMNYYDFLKTPYWKAISEYVKTQHNHTCQLCGATNTTLNVHHPATYKFRGYELHHMTELTCLCQACHHKFHKE